MKQSSPARVYRKEALSSFQTEREQEGYLGNQSREHHLATCKAVGILCVDGGKTTRDDDKIQWVVEKKKV